MSQEDQSQKTAKPTPKRIKEFRDRGDIAISRDLAQVAAMVGGCAGIAMFASAGATAIAGLLGTALASADGTQRAGLTDAAVIAFISCAAPVSIGALIGWAVAAAGQLGWPPALKKPSFDIGKIFTMSQIGQLVSPKAASGRVLKATAKVLFVGLAVTLALVVEFQALLARPDLEPNALARACGFGLLRLGAFAASALAVLAIIDFALAKRRIWNQMKMSQDELRKEHKEQEGDPHVKATRKRRAKELAGRRHAQMVPTADVVLVNPTEYAVAIRYSPDEGGAPRVVAKGRGEVAARIRELARRAGVPILRRPPLTRLIHKLVREGAEIPADLYQVVAEVLAYIYRIKARRRSA